MLINIITFTDDYNPPHINKTLTHNTNGVKEKINSREMWKTQRNINGWKGGKRDNYDPKTQRTARQGIQPKGNNEHQWNEINNINKKRGGQLPSH